MQYSGSGVCGSRVWGFRAAGFRDRDLGCVAVGFGFQAACLGFRGLGFRLWRILRLKTRTAVCFLPYLAKGAEDTGLIPNYRLRPVDYIS